eukprot:scaffold24508_cov66-Phaeocystis_antarctica.AAC.8
MQTIAEQAAAHEAAIILGSYRRGTESGTSAGDAQQPLHGVEPTEDEQHAEVADGDERVRMTTAQRSAPPLQRLAQQQLSGGEVALGLVSGCRLPRVSRRNSSASRYSGSAAARSPLTFNNSPPKLPMDVSVLGCRLPRVSRFTSSASRSSGSAAARSPLAINSVPRLLIELSVSGCRLPRVSRRPSSASLDSGSAAARSSLAYSSPPRLFMEQSVLGCRSPSVARLTSSAPRHSGSASSNLP